MISYNDACGVLDQVAARSLKIDQTLQTRQIRALSESVGAVLSRAVIASENLPAFDNSAMDGFAVRASEVNAVIEREGQCRLRVTAVVAAGDSPKASANSVNAGCALEIMTGAPFDSASFDSVVKVEEIERTGEDILLRAPVKEGQNVRRSGEDVRVGQMILPEGHRLRRQDVLTLAGLGVYEVEVFVETAVAIVSTGAELAPFEQKQLEPGQIRNSSQVYLALELKAKNCLVVSQTIVRDQISQYHQALRKAFDQGARVILSTGAVSMGKYDFVLEALRDWNAEVHFHKCAIRPGKPILFASLRYQDEVRFVFGLPGNPVSTAVGMKFFVEPFLRQLQGEKFIPAEEKTQARLTVDFKKPEGLRCFFKAIVREREQVLEVEPLSGQASFMVEPLIRANAWVLLPEEGSRCLQGQVVEIVRIEQGVGS